MVWGKDEAEGDPRETMRPLTSVAASGCSSLLLTQALQALPGLHFARRLIYVVSQPLRTTTVRHGHSEVGSLEKDDIVIPADVSFYF